MTNAEKALLVMETSITYLEGVVKGCEAMGWVFNTREICYLIPSEAKEAELCDWVIDYGDIRSDFGLMKETLKKLIKENANDEVNS